MVNILGSIILLYLFSYAYVLLDDIVDDIIWFIKKKLNGNKEVMTVSYDIFKDLKNSKPRELYLYVYRFFLHIKEFPEDTYYNIKYFIQRGIRGYSDRDLWSFDNYLAKMLSKTLRQLKDNIHGLPTWKEGKNEDECQKEWDEILDNIIYTFDTINNILDDDWIFVSTENKRSKLENIYYNNMKNSSYYVMNKNECERYKKGWKLFQKYYFGLWD